MYKVGDKLVCHNNYDLRFIDIIDTKYHKYQLFLTINKVYDIVDIVYIYEEKISIVNDQGYNYTLSINTVYQYFYTIKEFRKQKLERLLNV